jgi:hypothetical protein
MSSGVGGRYCEAVGIVERCLACEAVVNRSRGALPRLRGRGEPESWSAASLARPGRTEIVERCLACEAVVNNGIEDIQLLA